MSRLLLALLASASPVGLARAGDPPAAPLTLVVMDPLAAPLSCPCVKGYAQRDYAKLAKHLETKLNRTVTVVFGESLTATLTKKTDGKADIVIGKESVVRHESAANKLALSPVASLTGKDGKTTMTGLIVVPAKDAAISAGDLKEHKIIFGLPECDEKYLAAMTFLKELGVTPPKVPETCASCSDGATKALDAFKKGEKIATVISSYAQPLLEGCGTIQKGDLRVVGETDPVPFVVAFVNEKLPADVRAAVAKELLDMNASKDLLAALETKSGFVPVPAKKK
jgi:ABC-type phosphate/phosphonate transport system substrate-binding protein